MKKILIIALCLLTGPALAQPTGGGSGGGVVTQGTIPWVESVIGFPTTQVTGVPISVTTGGVTGALPIASPVVVVSNIGTTNNAYCKLGASVTTSDQLIAPTSWFAFTVGASTQITCITSTSTTTVNLVGGSGLPTGSGGGGSGGGGGGGLSIIDQAAWIQASSLFTPSGCEFNDTSTLSAGQQGTFRCTTKRAQIVDLDITGNAMYTAITSPIVAGTNIIGKVGIDQTTPGSTNGVVVNNLADPCMTGAKLNAPISTSSGGPVSLVALSGSTKVYVCSISAITDTAIKLSFIDGTGGACASAQHAIWGSTTAANGMSLAANGGFTQGSGSGTVGVTAAASALCLLQSGTSLVSGNLTYVQQ